MNDNEEREKLIATLKKIIADLEKGYDGFLYLYDVLCKVDEI